MEFDSDSHCKRHSAALPTLPGSPRLSNQEVRPVSTPGVVSVVVCESAGCLQHRRANGRRFRAWTKESGPSVFRTRTEASGCGIVASSICVTSGDVADLEDRGASGKGMCSLAIITNTAAV